ncbi:hypothetical protein EVAR_67698_1 [Eumeta japonica]|uniref:Uncharacterized protein n=1 Tax=Eumeta variegata TaxID=151549 RepID=A0A4C2A2K6_EUMVA|nr:hypothetical protein EVAR_67698_1 [Eumeta japonica]
MSRRRTNAASYELLNSEPEQTDQPDGFIDEQWVEPHKKFPWKTILFISFFFVAGASLYFVVTGTLQHLDILSNKRDIILNGSRKAALGWRGISLSITLLIPPLSRHSFKSKSSSPKRHNKSSKVSKQNRDPNKKTKVDNLRRVDKPKSLEQAFKTLAADDFVSYLEHLKILYPGSKLTWLKEGEANLEYFFNYTLLENMYRDEQNLPVVGYSAASLVMSETFQKFLREAEILNAELVGSKRRDPNVDLLIDLVKMCLCERSNMFELEELVVKGRDTLSHTVVRFIHLKITAKSERLKNRLNGIVCATVTARLHAQ